MSPFTLSFYIVCAYNPYGNFMSYLDALHLNLTIMEIWKKNNGTYSIVFGILNISFLRLTITNI